MTLRVSTVGILILVLIVLAGCSGGDTEPAKPVASKACGLISEKSLREITGKTKFYESSSDGYEYYDLGSEKYFPPGDNVTLICSVRSPKVVNLSRAQYVSIGASNMQQKQELRRELNITEPDDIDRSTKREIRTMRRDRSCSRLVTFPKHTGYICDETAGRRITRAFVVPNDRRQVRFFFYPSIDQSAVTPQNVLRWAEDVDRTIAQRDKLAAEEAKNDSKD